MGARIAIRVDGSHQIGMGHVFRMVNLTMALRKEGIDDITFYSRADRQVARWLDEKDINLELLELDGKIQPPINTMSKLHNVDLLINDLLDTSVDYMTEMSNADCCIVNFDDNGPGRFLADCRINALPCKMESQENGDSARLYQGPDYLLLGEEFSRHTPIRTINRDPKSILVTLGGSDTYGNILPVIAALQRIDKLQQVDVIIGPAFRCQDKLTEQLADDKRFTVQSSVPSIADIMRRHELAVVGGGITLFEAAACALPTIAVASEDFERTNIEWGEARGITRLAGDGQPASADSIFDAAQNLLEDWGTRRRMSELGPRVIDGNGQRRIVDIIKELCR